MIPSTEFIQILPVLHALCVCVRACVHASMCVNINDMDSLKPRNNMV